MGASTATPLDAPSDKDRSVVLEDRTVTWTRSLVAAASAAEGGAG